MSKTIHLNIKDFVKLNKVDKGTFGDLFLLKSVKTGEIYAGKFTIGSKSNTDSANKLSKEINIISKENHPSIIKFIGISPIDYENKPNPVIVTDYLPNGSLEQMINLAIHDNAPEQWDDTQKLITLYGIASGMAFLHSNAILHRDLTPSNILFDGLLFPKICDFGLSKEKKSYIKYNILPKGSPLYMAPEIFDSCNFSKASDVYSFAIIAYQIICDEKPIKFPENPQKLMKRVMKGKRYIFECQVGKSYRNLIKNCWNQDPTKRLTFEQIKEELKTDPGFIIETVDKEQFFKYVEFIDNPRFPYIPRNQNDNSDKNDDKINDDENFSLDEFPMKVYKKLDKQNKRLVYKAIKENDSDAQYNVAINFLHRINKFPKNSKLGIQYLKMAVDNDNIKALKSYCRIIIDDDSIPENIEQVKEKLNQHINDKDPEISLLFGLLCNKENKDKESVKYLENAIKEGNSEAMYELGMIYFNQSDHQKAKDYFDMAKNSGLKKLPPRFENTTNESIQTKIQNDTSTQTQKSKKKLTNKFASTTLIKRKPKKNTKKDKKLNSTMT